MHKTTYTPKDDDDQPAATRAVAAASATAQQPWWEWVDQRIEAAISVEHEFMMEVVGGALGTVTNDLCEQLEREDRALKREIKLLRRELTTLRDEVRVERGLRDLHEEVAEARQEVPKLRALEQRVRAEAAIARVDIGVEQSKLRHELEATKRTVSVLRARHSNTDFYLGRFMRSMQNIQTNEIAYESANERMVIRQQVNPDAAKALREFAAMVIDNDDVVH